jgi:hypothetical protein
MTPSRILAVQWERHNADMPTTVLRADGRPLGMSRS